MPTECAELQNTLRRSLAHDGMKRVCVVFGHPGGKPPNWLTLPVPSSLPVGLAHVAQAFVALQDARHDADYNLAQRVSRADALRFYESARSAFEQWRTVKSTPEAKAMLTVMLIFGRR